MRRLLVLLAILSTCLSTQGRANPQDSRKCLGWLIVALEPEDERDTVPATFLVLDREGRRTGKTSEQARQVEEIPRSQYSEGGLVDQKTGARGTDRKIVKMENPGTGYEVRVTGSQDGKYTLDVGGFGCDKKPFGRSVANVPIARGETHSYTVIYEKEVGEKVTLKRNP